MHGGIWQLIQDQLPDWIHPVFVDLPGHGTMRQRGFESLDQLVDYLDDLIDEPAVLVGWSMGGLVTLQLALRRPEKVLGLLQVASNPAFVKSAHWHHGVDAMIFQQFAENLKQDYATTLKRFLGLQVRGADNERTLLKQLRQIMAQQPQPDDASLAAGLTVLQQTDLLESLDQVRVPVSFMLGERDTLVPVSCGAALQSRNPAIQLEVIPAAGHAPFVSHPQAFIHSLVALCRQSGNVAA